MQTGTKTFTPVSFDKAKSIYDKLIKEKMAKGYSPGATGAPYAGTENAQRSTSILPQLLHAIDDDQVEKLIADPGYWMQQKFDGKRVIIQAGEKIVGVNRKGLTIALPESITKSAAEIRSPCVLDGEAIGDRFYAFDLLELNGTNYRTRPYSERHKKLFGLIDDGIGAIEFVETYCTEASKGDAFYRLKRANAEGVVFKNSVAAYTSGRPASGGPQLKFKFVATGSFIVAGVNAGKRSVGLEALNDSGKSVYVGNVTISRQPQNAKSQISRRGSLPLLLPRGLPLPARLPGRS
jgi:bifunctional non-homologous end joining protein LigD